MRNMHFKPEKHNRRSIRLKEYDYSKRGWYFITICTYKGEKLFGDALDGKLLLSKFGAIVEKFWLDIPMLILIILQLCLIIFMG